MSTLYTALTAFRRLATLGCGIGPGARSPKLAPLTMLHNSSLSKHAGRGGTARGIGDSDLVVQLKDNSKKNSL